MPETQVAENPYAAYGLNADGSPIVEGKTEEKKAETPDPRDVKIAALEKSLGEASEKLKDLDTISEKVKVVDRLMKAMAGDDDPDAKTRKKVWADLKDIAPAGVRKALEVLENDPDALEKLTGSVSTVHQARLQDLNIKAHDQMIGLAKKVFPTKGLDAAEINEMVYPYERTITDIINSNKGLRDRYVSGDLTVVEEIFNRLAKSHIQGRLKEKAARLAPSTAPKAPPKSGGPGATKDGNEGDKKPDIRTPKGRAQFHKEAFARFTAKRASSDDE